MTALPFPQGKFHGRYVRAYGADYSERGLARQVNIDRARLDPVPGDVGHKDSAAVTADFIKQKAFDHYGGEAPQAFLRHGLAPFAKRSLVATINPKANITGTTKVSQRQRWGLRVKSMSREAVFRLSLRPQNAVAQPGRGKGRALS